MGGDSFDDQYSAADDLVFRNAEAAARHMSPDALMQWRDVLAADLSDDDAVLHELASERVRAVNAELARRDRLSRLSRGVASPADQRYEQWRELARAVNERTDVPELLMTCGVVLTPAGHNARRNVREFSGACPLCGGTDRLRCWGGPNGRAWCRRCFWSADAIAIAQSFLPGSKGFRDAVKALAAMAGSEVPR